MLFRAIKHMLKYKTASVSINGIWLNAIVADTWPKRMIGLMYRDSMADDTCMLFVFSKEGKYGIWMHGMKFPIDTLWIGKDFTIVDIKEDMRPCIKCKIYMPENDAKYVIETNAGFARKNGIKKGLPIAINGIGNN